MAQFNLLDDISFGPLDNEHSIGDWDSAHPALAQAPAQPAPQSPFSKLFEPAPPPTPPPAPAGPSSGLLIDIGTTPPRAPLPASYFNSLPRRSSPLKHASLLSESTTSTIVDTHQEDCAPLPPTFRETPPSPETTRSPLASSSSSNRKWPSNRGKRTSPVKQLLRELSPIKAEAGDESCLSFGLPENFEQSLLINEGGSFLAQASADFTLDQSTAGLSAVGEEAEEEAQSSQGETILPASLTSSTSHARSVPPVANGKAESYRSLLACSTASYREHRDSPAKPRVVSIQAEQATLPATPTRKKLFAGIENDSSSPDCPSTGPSSSDNNVDTSPETTNLFDLSPPTALLHREATMTIEMNFDSPIVPNMPHVDVQTPESVDPDSPSIARILKSDLLGIGSDSVDLTHSHADMSINNLLNMAAPTGADISAWGDESMFGTVQFAALSSHAKGQHSVLAPLVEECSSPRPGASGAGLSRSSSEAAVGTLIELAPATPPPARPRPAATTAPLRTSTATPGKTPLAVSASERLRLKMAELTKKRAEAKGPAAKFEQAKQEQLCLLDDRPLEIAPTKHLQSRPSAASPEKRRMSIVPPASASRPRTLPTSNSARRLSTLATAPPATPGRSETTRERLDRAKEDRLRREAERSPDKKMAAAPARVAAELTKRPTLTSSNSATSALAGKLNLAPPKPRGALGPPASRFGTAAAKPAAAPGPAPSLARASSLKSRPSLSAAARPSTAATAASKIATPAKQRMSIGPGSIPGGLPTRPKLPGSKSAVDLSARLSSSIGASAGASRALSQRPNGH